jgi:hypothetical protein
METGGSISGIKQPEHEIDHSPSTAEVENVEVIMSWCLIN